VTATRPARPHDLPAAVEVWRLAQAATGTRPGAARLAEMAEQLAAPGLLVAVGTDDAGAVIALATGEAGPDEVLALRLLAVAPAARRQGYGTAVLEALTDHGWAQGCRRLVAEGPDDDAFLAAAGLEPAGDGRWTAELSPPAREVVVREAGLRLGQLLKLAGLVDTGSEAKELLAGGEVLVNGEVEARRGYQVADGDVVEAHAQAVRVVLPPTAG
jgi:ribosome-associated protein